MYIVERSKIAVVGNARVPRVVLWACACAAVLDMHSLSLSLSLMCVCVCV